MNATTNDPAVSTPQSRADLAAVEVPTLLLIVVTYAAWLLVTYQYRHWPLWLEVPAGILVLTMHSSLQHEILHGHPTRWIGLNRVLGIVPLSLWLPYDRYRQNHLQHHNDIRLTDPIDDPESFYWTAEAWNRMLPITRLALQAQQTLAGRIVIGSFWHTLHFLRGEVIALWNRKPGLWRLWLVHLLWCVPVVFWVTRVCHMPFWLYLVALVIPANGILLIRSFAEHRALPGVRQRIALVERSWVFGPLFLFNNLHALHHEAPLVPWYDYNARYRRIRERLIAENGGLVYLTYFDVARQYLFRPHDVLQHPTGRAPEPA
jgi:fatty acid desaturase